VFGEPDFLALMQPLDLLTLDSRRLPILPPVTAVLGQSPVVCGQSLTTLISHLFRPNGLPLRGWRPRLSSRHEACVTVTAAAYHRPG